MNYLFGSILLASTALAQSNAPTPVFDAADVHASLPGAKDGGMVWHSGRLEMHGATMLRLITTAYGVTQDKVFGGPAWLDSDRFDVTAKTRAGIPRPELDAMLRSLLAERFQLAVRNEDKPQPVFVLLPGKRVRLKQSGGGGESGCKRIDTPGYLSFDCHRTSIAALVELFSNSAQAYFTHPIVDRTGLTGSYDFSLKWTPRNMLGAGSDDAPSIPLFDYLDRELGIKVEQQTQPMPALAIERVNQTPSPNAPDIAEKLPPAPMEFEVAEVRVSKPGTQGRFNMQSGRLELLGLTLKDLIGFAFDMDDDRVTGGGKWLDSDHFDIIAKAAPTTTGETLRAMLQTLLGQRFHLVVHNEQQPVAVYALTAPKGTAKLKESAAEGRSECARNPSDGLVGRLCRHTTMEQLAKGLGSWAGGYLDHPVVDLTELKGAYDFSLSWAAARRVFGGRGGDPSAAPAAAPSTSSGMTIFEAVDKQLGLKLAPQKYPLPVLVVDHADRTPTDN